MDNSWQSIPCKRWGGRHRKEDSRPMLVKEYVYRLEWEKVHGPLTPDQKLHHKCENAWCIEVTHLEDTSQSDHMKTHGFGGDWGQADKTYCANGHEYTEENTYVFHRIRDGRPATERHCKICRRAAKARYRNKEK